MLNRNLQRILALVAASVFILSCAPQRKQAVTESKNIVVTYSILGALVRDLVGTSATVTVLIPNGLDVHEWEPSAKDIETLTKADLVVENGLGLEGGMEKALDSARSAGTRFFTASKYITVRHVGAGEGIPSGDPDQAVGAEDPHIWTDPVTMASVVEALGTELKDDFGFDLSSKTSELVSQLKDLDAEIARDVAALPQDKRKLVTGHESLGYFAQRYGFKLVGAVIPSLTTEAESSAADLVALKKLIAENRVSVVFTELGTPARTVETLASEAKVRAVSLTTHSLPKDGSYFTFERELAGVIVGALGK